MRNGITWIKEFIANEDGPTAVEYAVMLALIIAACVGAITALSTAVQGRFNGVAATVAPAG